MIIPVILCGGVGSRLWPLSREDNPKQFLRLQNNRSLFQETVLRVSDPLIFGEPIIICGEGYRFKVASELEEIGIKPYAIVLEPCQRNTAPAIAVAAAFIKGQHTMLVLPADHSIKNNDVFIEAVGLCQNYSDKGIITFGILPNYAATGYGYIQMGSRLAGEVYTVKTFTEKPDALRAEGFIKSGDYFWNSGMFLVNNDFYLQELEKLKPDLLACTIEAVKKSKRSFNFIELEAAAFSQAENVSIDVAILEKSKNVLLHPIKLDWLDLGNWKSVHADMRKSLDKDENVMVGEKTYVASCTNSLVYSDGTRHLTVSGLDNVCVINTEDAVLVINKDHTEAVKEIYADLKLTSSDLVKRSTKNYRPWGYYEVILDSPTYKIKRIFIAPGQSISLQYHMKRAEHWVVTKGVATVTKGKQLLQLERNESIYIPIGEVHKIANNSSDGLEFIEVQIGEVLTEEDIVRLEDKYGRVKTAVT
jgi:mannose-1-phosphate guanylyltransferase/mannose-6-phosphate isomerase